MLFRKTKKLVIIFSLLFFGCGYRTTAVLYSETGIIVTPVVNEIDITADNRSYGDYRTFPILLEKRLTNELISKFNIDGSLKVVNFSKNALKIDCVIKDYTKDSLRYSDNDDVEEQRLRLKVRMTLLNSSDEVLQDKIVEGETTYYISGSNSKSESSAQSDLIDDTARRLLEAVVESW
ncbi:MAG: LPS assembly lipoprotein LptE [Candidatus Omnitrophica bacterium]|nr:LPS assembly lipoprotein LptE [Candidatus Omnitrophota bacterium]